MTETILSSPTKEVVLGFDRPFVIIGERINPTGRKQLAAEMAAGNFDTVIADTIAQVEAGAQMLDVNAGIPLADEPGILAHTVQLVQSITDVPLSIDSSIVEALEAGLSVYQGKALVNSVTGEDEQMERVLPLVAKHGAAVVAISNDETGISEDPDVRFEVARKIVSRAEDFGIKREDIVVDPLVMPIGAMGTAGRQVFRLVRRLQDELRVEHDLRRVQRQLRAPESNGPQRGVSADGDRVGADERDHEPAARRDAARREGGGCDDGQRSALRLVDRTSRRQRRRARRPAGAAGAMRGAAAQGRPQRRDDQRGTGRLHPVREARHRGAGHDRARCRTPPRRRSRLRLRWPRDLWSLPGHGERRASTQSTASPVAPSRSRRSRVSRIATRASGRWSPVAASGAQLRSSPTS